MVNVSHNKSWLLGGIQVHYNLTPTPINNCDQERNKAEAGFIKVGLRRNPASDTSYIYKYKIDLFENGNP